MSKIQICEIGQGRFEKTNKMPFISTNTFLEFDGVILNPENISFHSLHFGKAYERTENLIEFIEYKKIPIILFAPINEYFLSNDNESILWHDFLPTYNFSIKKESGNIMEVIKNTIFTDFLEKYKLHFHYTSYFMQYEGTSILQTPLTKKTLAYYNDNIIFLPRLNESILSIEDSFLSDLLKVAKQVTKEEDMQVLPDWASSYYVENEKEVFIEGNKLAEEILRLDAVSKNIESQLISFNQRKQIFTGTGNVLEREIEKLFKDLGFEILEVDPNRDDLIIRHNNKIAVVEIKGVVGTSAEKHSNQLEKWVSNYFDETEIRAKGILIVNTFKDKPLKERTEPSFPHQMLKYSVSREHCLITSLQFFGLYTEAMTGERKEELINSLFDTIGVYSGFEKWEDFIEV